jgi:hypothetical protein
MTCVAISCGVVGGVVGVHCGSRVGGVGDGWRMLGSGGGGGGGVGSGYWRVRWWVGQFSVDGECPE